MAKEPERILIIEDDADVAELLVMFFNRQGYNVFHADTGTQGIVLAGAKLPNMILLDIMLPDMEGFDVCTVLRGRNLTKYIPTIFLTQRNAQADKVSGLELGADDYITKPFDIEELGIRVEQSIKRATRDHLHEEITGLPTGPLVEAEYEAFKAAGGKWQSLEISVQGFEAFRDAYGFLTANDALNLAARVLTDAVIAQGTNNDFIGVVDSGRFVIFTFSTQTAQMIQAIKDAFKERSAALYRFTDLDQGYLVVDEGKPSQKQVPLMYLEVSPKV